MERDPAHQTGMTPKPPQKRNPMIQMPLIATKRLIDAQVMEKKIHYTPVDKPEIPKLLPVSKELILEEPLSINVQGKTYSVIMRTPGEEKAHAAGFCLSEGVVDHPDDIADIALCNGEDSNVAAVMLTKERANAVADLLNRKGFVSQTSCGICGREIIEDLSEILESVPQQLTLSISEILEIIEQMDKVQQLKHRSQASHAALIFNKKRELISVSEDAGRHNALDKAIGKLFLSHRLPEASIALLSSRASYEMVQKCARAGIEIVLTLSFPTALARDLGESIGMTMVAVRKKGFHLFTGGHRITEK